MQSLFNVSGKKILVTGGAQGMGRMIAEGFLNAGAKVYFTSRKPDIVAQAQQEMSALGDCVGIVSDLSTPEAAAALAQEIGKNEDGLDVLINNAGKTWGAPLESFPDKAWASVMAVNVQGPFTLVRELLPLLKKAGSDADPARVINIGSLAGAKVERLSAYSYAASKAAIHHLSRELAAELADKHVTVNTVVPGYFPTKMTAHVRGEDEELNKLLERVPLQRLGESDDIKGACIFLSSRAANYITGTELFVDGGMNGCR
jgi:NAD(P)-dependent dehydrogenase (short-subunit alcohol dehydrogenase family)